MFFDFVLARVDFKATESEGSVKLALSNIFPSCEIKREDGGFFVESNDETTALEPLKKMVWDKKILDTVRGRLLRSEKDGKVTLLVNKQAALAGRIGVCDREDESPLGAIHVTFDASLIDWFSPKTSEGKPI